MSAVLLTMEGTNLGTDKPWLSEDELETEFVRLFRETPGRVFVAWSGQNIDLRRLHPGEPGARGGPLHGRGAGDGWRLRETAPAR